jgi:hypothetical protein
MEADSSKSRQNGKEYGEKYFNEACRLNLYPMDNHGNYKSQYQVSHF